MSVSRNDIEKLKAQHRAQFAKTEARLELSKTLLVLSGVLVSAGALLAVFQVPAAVPAFLGGLVMCIFSAIVGRSR